MKKNSILYFFGLRLSDDFNKIIEGDSELYEEVDNGNQHDSDHHDGDNLLDTSYDEYHFEKTLTITKT